VRSKVVGGIAKEVRRRPAESLVEDALTVTAGELAAGRPDAACRRSTVGIASALRLQARASLCELLAAGRSRSPSIALAAAKPRRITLVAVRVLRTGPGGRPGRPRAALAEAAVARCAGARFSRR
jgi:hypothetical protein